MSLINLDSIFATDQPWPPTSELDRIRAYDTNARLYKGEPSTPSSTSALDDRRYNRVPETPRISLNWYRRVCALFSDLLWGEAPRFTSKEHQDTLDRIIEGNGFYLTGYDATVDLLRFGTALFKVRFDPGRGSIIDLVDPRLWFPVVNPDDKGETVAHVIAWEVSQGDQDYVRAEIHLPGKILNRLYKLKDHKIEKSVDLATIPRYTTVPDEVETGLDDFLVVPVGSGISDFDSIRGAVDEMEKRAAQISRVLDVHADPKMSIPSQFVEYDPYTKEPGLKVSGSHAFFVHEGGDKPEYLTWDASLGAAFSQLSEMRDHLYALGEISPSILGDTRNGLAESGSALKRLALPTLSKVNRIRQRLDPQLKRVLEISAKLELVSRYPGATLLDDTSIRWKDGLPEDPAESSKIESALKQNSLTSRRSAVARLNEDLDDAGVDEEVRRIEADIEGESGNLL